MKEPSIYERLSDNPIIAAIKEESELDLLLDSEVEVIFILQSTIFNIAHISEKIKESGKVGFIHFGFVKGLSEDEMGLRYLREHTQFQGIILTKVNQIKAAKSLGFLTVHRIFMLDSISLESLKHLKQDTSPDFVEILPNSSGKVIKLVQGVIKRPLIVSGLILDKEDIINALSFGAIAISSTNRQVWGM
ncbi:glycerol-3-phosphate responsive antiterminator [Vagococcus zengguangii]|uniref:Glycerol uptake operon antiterminator regulatory protein n=1 Tax=Vagococcus zengguangii TaxID=2571750 RepID=A0A4D7CUC5_9ENTE|nr:glycerol-3-phosphate responsive antiterminator [Vagococcus zengguangii]QCI85836.1 glycerol-3-phosphate responsive antiterminator [Vagococcus zengguangii]TLG81777.1 glycerol-3-phosphate responsive antiterminator [Vagococcus zengguangii]